MAVLNTTSATDRTPRPAAPNAVPRKTEPSASARRAGGGKGRVGIGVQCSAVTEELWTTPVSDDPAADRRGGRYVRVAVERGIDAVSRGGGARGGRAGQADGLTYWCAADDVGVGERVEVPLGRGNKRAAGVVIAAGGEELL